jgi:hypothetical protein
MKYLATLRATFDAEDELEAQLLTHDMTERLDSLLEDDDTVDVTQLIPFGVLGEVEPAELVNLMRRVRDMLIMTRIVQCFDLAKGIDQTAWILEHRAEATFDLSGYNYTALFDRADELLGRHLADKREG